MKRCHRAVVAYVAAVTCAGCTDGYHVGSNDVPTCPAAAPAANTTSVEQQSHWAEPWRQLVRTRPATQLTGAFGMGLFADAENDRAVPLLARSGLRRAKIFTHWANMTYEDPTRIEADALQRITRTLETLVANGLRPTLQLTSTTGTPCPSRQEDLRLVQPAKAGDRTLKLDPAAVPRLVPGRTGLRAVAGLKVGEPLITAVARDGTATLSRPLPIDLAAGSVRAITFRYSPFGRPRTEEGMANPFFEESAAGWLAYVAAMTKLAVGVAGAGNFDIELMLPAGTFLDVNQFHEADVDEGVGDAGATVDALTTMTLQWLRDPVQGLTGVAVGDGSGVSSVATLAGPRLPRFDAIIRTAITGGKAFGPHRFTSTAQSLDAAGMANGALNAEGLWQETFTPTYAAFFPERPLTATLSRALVWDFLLQTQQPQAKPIWLMSLGIDAGWLAEQNVTLAPAQLWRLKTKWVLRSLAAYAGVGATVLHFFGQLANETTLVDVAAPDGGEVMRSAARFTAAFTAPDVQASDARDIRLTAVTSCERGAQFEGDGSSRFPTLWNRDVVSFLPFQTGRSSFAAAVYVMTRNLVEVRRPDLQQGDAARFDLAPQTMSLHIAGLASARPSLVLLDPVSGETTPIVGTVSADGLLTADLALTDVPRVLIIDDAAADAI